MTPRERNKRATEYKRLLNSIDKRYVSRVYNALKQQISSFTKVLTTQGVQAARNHLSALSFNARMTGVIKQMHLTTGLLLANRTYSELSNAAPKLKYRTFGYNQHWTEEMNRYFRIHLLNSVTNISEATKKDILRVMEKGIAEGWSVDRMAKEINDKAYLAYRAKRIIRTESGRAANYGTQLSADVYEYEVVKEWISVHDDRTRHSHVTLDGQLREMEEPYSNGLMFPGDPEGALKEIVNCRCLQAIVPKRDAQGRLIPKENFIPIPARRAA